MGILTQKKFTICSKKVGLFITDQVGEDNEAARKFYESIGFVDTGKSCLIEETTKTDMCYELKI